MQVFTSSLTQPRIGTGAFLLIGTIFSTWHPLPAKGNIEDRVNGTSNEVTANPISTTKHATPLYDGDFVVTQNDKPCIRASFHASFRIKYASSESGRLRVRETVIAMPPIVNVSGECTSDFSSSITLSWKDGNFSLKLKYSPEERVMTKDGKLSTEGWSASTIELTIDTRDSTLFSKPLYPGRYTVTSAPGEAHYWAARNHSFQCTAPQRVILLEYGANGSIIEENVIKVAVFTSHAHTQAFDLPPNGSFSPATTCETDIYNAMPRQSVMPVIVAACLAAIIVIIIVGYVISKNISRSTYRGIE